MVNGHFKAQICVGWKKMWIFVTWKMLTMNLRYMENIKLWICVPLKNIKTMIFIACKNILNYEFAKDWKIQLCINVRNKEKYLTMLEFAKHRKDLTINLHNIQKYLTMLKFTY